MKVEVKPSQIVLKNDLNKIGSYKIDIPKNCIDILLISNAMLRNNLEVKFSDD